MTSTWAPDSIRRPHLPMPAGDARLRAGCRGHPRFGTAAMPDDDISLLKRLYGTFNARDMQAVLAMMHPDVVWANGMDGGHVHGHDGVRDYWTRQWAVIDPHVEPIGFSA